MGDYAYVADPDGNVFGLWHDHKWTYQLIQIAGPPTTLVQEGPGLAVTRLHDQLSENELCKALIAHVRSASSSSSATCRLPDG